MTFGILATVAVGFWLTVSALTTFALCRAGARCDRQLDMVEAARRRAAFSAPLAVRGARRVEVGAQWIQSGPTAE